jgi:putative flippase GtrA
MIGRQFIRYAIIGLLLNGDMYVAYLLLTSGGLASTTAMSVTYASGVLIGFLLNRSVTFRYHRRDRGALLRYIATYLAGYAVDYACLSLLVRHAGLPHECVQLGVTVALPVLLFAMQKYWVFPRAQALRIVPGGVVP